MIKTLIVGENGFIAKRLSKYIDSMGCKSINYQLTTSSSEIKNDTIFLDLSDAENFDYSLLENFSYVILLGGVSSPDFCENNPIQSKKLILKELNYLLINV